jgi:hypothetical protein
VKTSHGHALRELQRSLFEQYREHEKQHPDEVNEIVASIVAHLWSAWPESVSPLGTLGAPTEKIVDPREAKS